MKTYTMKERIESQQGYAEQFAEWLLARPKVTTVRTASQKDDLLGTDYYFTTEDGEEYSVQLKVDFIADTSGNLPFETVSQAYDWRPSVIGAEFKMTHVDYLFFLLVPSLRILCYKPRQFINYAIANYEKLRNFAAYNDNDDGLKYRTLGGLIRIHDIKHLLVLESRLN